MFYEGTKIYNSCYGTSDSVAHAHPVIREFCAEFAQIDEIFDRDELALASVRPAEFRCGQFYPDAIEFRHVVAQKHVVNSRSPSIMPVFKKINSSIATIFRDVP